MSTTNEPTGRASPFGLEQTFDPAQMVSGAHCAGSTGWGAWAVRKFDPEEPECVRCGQALTLMEGCEWDDTPELNLCYQCALTVLEQMRPNTEVSGRLPAQQGHDSGQGERR